MSANRFVRTSKFRHVYGSARKREQCYDGLNISYDSNDTHLAKCNGKYLSVHWAAAGGGAFAVIPVEAVGKMPADIPLFEGHSSQVLDTEFSPFNDDLIASTGEDGKLLLWNIPQPGNEQHLGGAELKPALSIQAHERRVVDLLFHPTVENVLASASHDQTVKIWDLEKASCRVTLTGHNDAVLDQSWNYNGSQLATTSRDKSLRIFDPRVSNTFVAEASKAHDGVKGLRVVWLGNSHRIATTGFSKMSDRQFSIWDQRNLSAALKTENLDTSSGLLIPHFDADTRMLFLSGKGDGNIRYYEIVDEAPYYHFISEYKSVEPQRAVTFLPKRAVSVSENEIARAYKVQGNMVEPISFRVPRKSEGFQADLFPETPGPIPALTATEFFDERKPSEPKLVSLANGFAPSLRRDFTVSLDGLDTSSFSQSASGLLTSEPTETDEVRRLRTENAALRAELEQLKDQLAKIKN